MQPASPDRPSALNASAAWGIPLFYAVAVLARTVVIVIIPTLAFRHFDNASLVSALYFIASWPGCWPACCCQQSSKPSAHGD
ncbi:hypothetical protein DEA98_25455 [Brucella pseudogrignonensis]|nr:hypothetical protein [Brucella pseudogrignonensis]